MNRKQFLKSTAAITGSIVVLGCERSLVSDLMPVDDGKMLSIDEANEWFHKVYLERSNGARIGENKRRHKRIAQWDKAIKYKVAGKQEFVWVPIGYEDDRRPVVVDWDEKTEYKQKLAKYFAQPLVEGVVVLKDKGNTTAFLVQIIYDSVALQMNDTITRDNFTGWLVRADWDDRFIDGYRFKDGRRGEFFVNKEAGPKNGRMYQLVTFTYQTVTGRSCGPNCSEITVSIETGVQYIWIPDGGGAAGPAGGGGNNGSYYDPGFASGGGDNNNGSISGPVSFHMTTALSNRFSNDRKQFSQTLKDSVNATGLAASMAGFTLDKAQAIAGAVGAELRILSPVVGALGRSCAVMSLATSAGALYIGVAEDGFTWDGDGWNAVQTALGAVGLGLVIFGAAPVFGVAVGAVSIGIAIGTTVQGMN